MKDYKLGPNGAIITCLNLFATKFDQVISLLEKNKTSYEYVIIDTPGQIEVFTWSASGTIITESLSSLFPTTLCYCVDTPKSSSPVTFMSNMLYACSMLYKTRLPLVVALNKVDVVDCRPLQLWMSDFEAFQEALTEEGSVGERRASYGCSFANSLSLVLDEFYSTLKSVGVSAVTGSGIPELVAAFDEMRELYITEFLPGLEKMKEERVREQLSNVKLDADMLSESDRKAMAADRVFLNPGADDLEVPSTRQNDEDDPQEKIEYESFKAFVRDVVSKKNSSENNAEKDK